MIFNRPRFFNRRSSRSRSRRAVAFALAAAAAAVLPAARAAAQISIGLEQVGANIGGPPLDLTHAGDGTNRLFAAGQYSGDVRVFSGGNWLATPFLDVNGTGGIPILQASDSSESGLLGMAFHPNFGAAANVPGSGKFYTYTSEFKAGNFNNVDFIHDELDDASNRGHHDSVIREWSVNPGANTVNYAAGSRELLRIRQPQSNHNGGAMKFGPDGHLYIAMGDGGGSNDNSGGTTSTTDGHTNENLASNIYRGNGQDIRDYALERNNNVLGKILRIDPRAPAATPGSADPISTNGKYRIPSDNPFIAGNSGAREVYAYGLRNPFRMSFDRAGSNALYVGDVGQGQWEEIDIITKGGNYGWVYREGAHDFVPAASQPQNFTSINPVAEYSHSVGLAVIGGFVYRGQNIPELYGKYVFGDLGFSTTGKMFYMDAAGGAITQFSLLANTPMTVNSNLYAFGEDRDGELYATFSDGTVRRILGRQWLNTTGGSWNTSAAWLGAIPSGQGAPANFLGRVTAAGNAPATITLDGSKTVGTLRFNNDVTNGSDARTYRIAPGSGGTLTLDNGASTALIQAIRGTHEVAVPLQLNSHTDIDAAATGTLIFSNTVTGGATRTITKKGAGAARMTAGLTLGSGGALAVTGGTLQAKNIRGSGAVNINGGNVAITPDGSSAGTSKVNALTITGASRLDLANNKLITTTALGSAAPGPGGTRVYSGISGYIQSGFVNGQGDWSGPGIVTSTEAAQGGLTTLGSAVAGEVLPFESSTIIWGGQTVSMTDTIVMYTHAGDANLDGSVDGGDYAFIDAYVGSAAADAAYYKGDFNYDGFIDGGDYAYIDVTVGSTPIPASGDGGATLVPEPAGATLLALAAAGTLRRRRRRRA